MTLLKWPSKLTCDGAVPVGDASRRPANPGHRRFLNDCGKGDVRALQYYHHRGRHAAADFLKIITSRDTDLHPPAAPSGERYALSCEERAGTHRIACLLIERTIPAIFNGLRRFCNVIAPSRGRITRIQCRQVGVSSAVDKEACNRSERASNQAALHQRTPRNHSIDVRGPLGNNRPVQSTEPDQW